MIERVEALAPLWLLVGMLAASAAVTILAGRWALPSTVVLVLVGLVVALVVPPIAGTPLPLPVTPDLLLAIVLPGLVFEAAFRTSPDVLRPAAAPILFLAIPGVVVVAAIVAAVLSLTSILTPPEGFVVGAMVAATDPAAVLSTFKRVRVPAQLATTVEMESLVNDGTGIVLFALALDLLAGHASIGGALIAFVVGIVGSTAIGAVIGLGAALVVRRVHEPLAELTITIVLAYGTFLVANAIGGSGVIATLAAASVFGSRARDALSERAVEAIDVVWELVAFVLTAGVFLLVGVFLAPLSMIHAIGPIAVGILAVLLARAVVVYGLLGGASRLLARRTEPMPLGWLHVLFWAGLRGAVSFALALSLPADVPHRELLQAITFGIVLFTLLVQGSTVGRVVRWAGLAEPG